MLNTNKTGLKLFDNFEIDFDLPKWQERKKEGASFMIYNNIDRRSGSFNVTGNIAFTIAEGHLNSYGGDPTTVVPQSIKKETFINKLFSRVIGRSNKEEEIKKQLELQKTIPEIIDVPKENISQISVEEFFSSVKNSKEELVLVKERIENYDKALETFKKMGQVALYENIKIEVEIHRAESQLYAIGMTKFISEENLIKFAKQSPKELKLDWIKHFVRLIPHNVAESKMIADERHIFDNYCVLHYDPDGKGNTLTAEEKAKKADPILFGVLAGRKRLYYIGDWIDEYCDLTFDNIVNAIGEGSIGKILPEISIE